MMLVVTGMTATGAGPAAGARATGALPPIPGPVRLRPFVVASHGAVLVYGGRDRHGRKRVPGGYLLQAGGRSWSKVSGPAIGEVRGGGAAVVAVADGFVVVAAHCSQGDRPVDEGRPCPRSRVESFRIRRTSGRVVERRRVRTRVDPTHWILDVVGAIGDRAIVRLVSDDAASGPADSVVVAGPGRGSRRWEPIDPPVPVTSQFVSYCVADRRVIRLRAASTPGGTVEAETTRLDPVRWEPAATLAVPPEAGRPSVFCGPRPVTMVFGAPDDHGAFPASVFVWRRSGSWRHLPDPPRDALFGGPVVVGRDLAIWSGTDEDPEGPENWDGSETLTFYDASARTWLIREHVAPPYGDIRDPLPYSRTQYLLAHPETSPEHSTIRIARYPNARR